MRTGRGGPESLAPLTYGAVLLVFVAWGLRAAPAALSSTPTPHGEVPVWLLLAALAAGAAAIGVGAVLAVRRIHWRGRSHEGEHVLEGPPRWARLQALLALGLLAAAVGLVVWAAVHVTGPPGHAAGQRPAPAAPPPSGVTPSTVIQPVPSTGSTPQALAFPWVDVVAAVIGLLIVLGLVHLARRRRGRTSGRPPQPARPRSLGGTEEQASDVESLRDPRASVIRTFRAFEHDAARHGVVVNPPSTATQIATRAVSRAMAEQSAVQELTRLFHRARYSADAVAEADRRRAEQLLEGLRRGWEQ